MKYVFEKYRQFYEEYRYWPQYFTPYNCQEVTDFAITLGTQCGTPGHIGNMLITEGLDGNICNHLGKN